jgi:hypothetical protein
MSIQQRPTEQRPSTDRTVGPDGQRIIQQQVTAEEERADIARASERQEVVARDERAKEPSTRFWSSRRVQVGPILALLAGVITLAFRTWPIAVPQGRGTLGTSWFIAATVVGVVYIVGFFLADTRWKLARTVLVVAAVVHIVIGLGFGSSVQAQEIAPGLLSMLYDLVPAAMALIAALLMAPPPATLHEHR